MSGATGRGAGGDKRIENGLLRGIGYGLEEQIDVILVQDTDIDQGCLLIVQENIGRCKAKRDVAAAVAPERSEARESDAGAADDALELPVAQRDVCGCKDDDRSLLSGTSFHVSIRWNHDPAVGKTQI